ncbi:hypothetical protein Chor_009047 [Crotalus horridus]
MFKKLAKQLIQEMDSDGKLIPVSSLAQNDGFQIFSLVTKKPYKWPWNNRKYSPISFKLADIFQEEAIMEIELKHSEPLLFSANTCHKSGGRLNFKIRSTEVDVGGLALACLNASSVHLRKTYVDPGELWKRDISLSVVQQMYPKLHLYIVTEVLEIMEPFLIEEIVQTGGKGEVSAMDILKIQGQHTTMKNKSMLIPFGTVMAYGVEKFQICEEDPVYLNQRFQTMLVPSPTYDAFQSELGSSLTGKLLPNFESLLGFISPIVQISSIKSIMSLHQKCHQSSLTVQQVQDAVKEAYEPLLYQTQPLKKNLLESFEIFLQNRNVSTVWSMQNEVIIFEARPFLHREGQDLSSCFLKLFEVAQSIPLSQVSSSSFAASLDCWSLPWQVTMLIAPCWSHSMRNSEFQWKCYYPT